MSAQIFIIEKSKNSLTFLTYALKCLYDKKYIKLEFDKNYINDISKYDSLKTDKNSIIINNNICFSIEDTHVQDINSGITKVFADYSNESCNEDDLRCFKHFLQSNGIKNFENVFFICQNRFLKNNSHNIKILIFDFFPIMTFFEIASKIDHDYIEKIINSIHNNTTRHDILCLNATPRDHRLVLLVHMFHKGIDFKKNLISFPGYVYHKGKELIKGWRCDTAAVIGTDPGLVHSLSLLEQSFPLIVDDTKGKEGNSLAYFIDTDMYLNSKLSIVTETSFYANDYRITEKTMKPLLLGHPLYVLGPPRTLNVIEDLGFKVAEPEIQEKIDNEKNLNKKCELIVNSTNEFLKNYESLEYRKKIAEVVLHNMQWGREGFILKYYEDYIKILWQEINN